MTNFLDELEAEANGRTQVLFRYPGHNFMALKSKFVKEVIQSARMKATLVRAGIDVLSPLEKLAFYVLDEADTYYRGEPHPAPKKKRKAKLQRQARRRSR